MVWITGVIMQKEWLRHGLTAICRIDASQGIWNGEYLSLRIILLERKYSMCGSKHQLGILVLLHKCSNKHGEIGGYATNNTKLNLDSLWVRIILHFIV